MAAAPKMSLEQLQQGLSKTPGRADFNTIAGRALAGIDPRYLGGFDPLAYQSTFNNLYDQLASEFAGQDLQLGQLYNDYETQYGRLGDDEQVANRKLMNAMANRGTLSSGAYLDESENVAGDFNRLRGDLGSNLQRGFTDAAARRLQAISGYNTGLSQQELGLGQSAKSYAQGLIQAEAQAKAQEEYRAQQERANQAMLAQQQAAIDARMAQQAEMDAQTRAWQESQADFQRQLAAAMAMNQTVNQPTSPPAYSFLGSEPPYVPPPAYGQPGYKPQIKSNPALAPVPGGANSFTGGGGTRVNTGIPGGTIIAPGYTPQTRRGVNPNPLGSRIAV